MVFENSRCTDLTYRHSLSAIATNVEASADVLENVPSAHTDADQTLLSKLPISSSGQGLSDAIRLTSGGVVADSSGFFHPQGDHGETTYVVDGQPISDQQNKTFSTQLPPNAFQSLELVTSAPNAEYGDKTGLIVNTVTRSGLGQKPTVSLETYYGSFGTFGEDATFGIGGAKWGNFLVADSKRSGRFSDSPEFTPFHDKGNSESIFDRIDFQPTNRDSLHLNLLVLATGFKFRMVTTSSVRISARSPRRLALALVISIRSNRTPFLPSIHLSARIASTTIRAETRLTTLPQQLVKIVISRTGGCALMLHTRTGRYNIKIGRS